MPVTYQRDGGEGGGGGGDLFAGMKFFIHRLTPMRTQWIERVQDNGGMIVPLEQHADVKIADRLKPAKAPLDSFSYEFIDHSVKEGILKPLEPYKIKQNAGTGLAAKVPAKGPSSRTKFTNADDHLLYRWINHWENVEKKKGNQLKTNGNAIFQHLAANYPNHTYQSWRSRWVNILSKVPESQRPQDLSGEPLDTDTPEEKAQKAKKAARNSASPSADEAPAVSPNRTRTEFSAADDNILLEYVREYVRDKLSRSEHPHLKGLNMYQELGEKHSQHSAQSWKDRFARKILPEHTEFQNADAIHTPTHPRQKPTPPVLSSPLRRDTILETPAGHEPAQSSAEAEETHEAGIAAQANASDVPEDDDTGEISDEEDEDETEAFFLQNLEAFFLQGQRLGQEVFKDWRSPKVGGREIPIFDLWTAVMSLKAEPADRDWLKVAEELGFPWEEDQDVPDQLYSTFARLLADYEDVINELENRDQNAQSVEPSVTAESLPNSSPLPTRPTAKRPRADDDYMSSPKRRKTEIPTTPDHVTGTAHLRIPSDNIDADGADEAEGYVEDMDDIPAGRRRQQAREPETQDFGFEPETQYYDVQSEEFDTQYTVSPSQQLLEENRASTPSPMQNPNNAMALDNTGPETPLAKKPVAKRRSLPKGFGRSPKGSEQPRSPPSVPVHDTPADTIERFVGLGYDRPIVIRALDAATWRPGTAGAVMEILRKGGAMPNAQMVWTSRDDEALMMATLNQPPKDAKEERKRAKKMEKLVEKHTAEDVELRKRYLEVRDERLKEVEFA